ncbi:MAG TPA: isocitrate/isopropylmalate family dehydrogenase [Gaiellaceae bacterium]|nr:isocitrate/isopropylmalate family dehydrogenase [Gaiellaceae bacterium]
MRRTHSVACLAGDGTGPELMAEACRTLHSVARVHGFVVEDVHVPFGSEALTRSGHPLPQATRSAYLEADAVLVAALDEPALAGVESELDLRARLTRVVHRRGAFTLLSPAGADSERWTVERAFAVARRSRGRLASVDPDDAWAALADEVGDSHAGVDVEHLSVRDGLEALAFEPQRFDVLVTGQQLSRLLDDVAALLERDGRVVACGRLAASGPSIFAPAEADGRELAGSGVVDPCPMLLAASLLLAEGLGEARAGETLAGALTAARSVGADPVASVRRTLAASTRELADAVLRLLPVSHRGAEFVPEALA